MGRAWTVLRTISDSSVEVIGNGMSEPTVNLVQQELSLCVSVGHSKDRARSESGAVREGNGKGGARGMYNIQYQVCLRDELRDEWSISKVAQ